MRQRRCSGTSVVYCISTGFPACSCRYSCTRSSEKPLGGDTSTHSCIMSIRASGGAHGLGTTSTGNVSCAVAPRAAAPAYRLWM